MRLGMRYVRASAGDQIAGRGAAVIDRQLQLDLVHRLVARSGGAARFEEAQKLKAELAFPRPSEFERELDLDIAHGKSYVLPLALLPCLAQLGPQLRDGIGQPDIRGLWHRP